MPHYFMNILDGEKLVKDTEGSIYANDAAAETEARAAAREMLAEQVRSGSEIGSQTIEVVDANGRSIARLRLRDQIRLRPETNPLA